MSNNKQKKWYHYVMLSFEIQWIIVGVALLITLIQLGFYSLVDYNIVLFEDECAIVVNETSIVAQCDDTEVALKSALTAEILFAKLNSNFDPILICTHTTSKYLAEYVWTCNVKGKNTNAKNIH